jgi:glutaredoxin
MQTNLFKEAIIWTKKGCSSCEVVKNLLMKNNYEIEIRNIEDPKYRKELITYLPETRTVPQVVIGGRYIGGLKQVQEYLDRK